MTTWRSRPNLLKEIGFRVRSSREKKFQKSKDAAAAIKCSPQLWAQIESGNVKLTPEKLCDLAEFLGVSYEWLACGIENPQPVTPVATQATRTAQAPTRKTEDGEPFTPDQSAALRRLATWQKFLAGLAVDAANRPAFAVGLQDVLDDAEEFLASIEPKLSRLASTADVDTESA